MELLENITWETGSLGIIGTQLSVTLKPPNTIVLLYTERFQGALNWVPMMPRDARLSDCYTSVRCCFFQSGYRVIIVCKKIQINFLKLAKILWSCFPPLCFSLVVFFVVLLYIFSSSKILTQMVFFDVLKQT